MHTCDEYIEMISAMIDGELSENLTEELEAHLSVCSSCRRVRDAFLSFSECLEPISPPAGFTDNVMHEISKLGKRKNKVITYLKSASVLAACIGIIIFSVSKAGVLGSYERTISKPLDTALVSGRDSVPSESEQAAEAVIEDSPAETAIDLSTPTDMPKSRGFVPPQPDEHAADSGVDISEGSEPGDSNSSAGDDNADGSENSPYSRALGMPSTFSASGNPIHREIPENDEHGISNLHSMEEALVYPGTSEDEIISQVTDADTLYKIADLLSWKEYPPSDFVLGDPVYTMEAKIQGGHTYVVRIWSKDNLLYCAVDNSGVLFTASGELTMLNGLLGLTQH